MAADIDDEHAAGTLHAVFGEQSAAKDKQVLVTVEISQVFGLDSGANGGSAVFTIFLINYEQHMRLLDESPHLRSTHANLVFHFQAGTQPSGNALASKWNTVQGTARPEWPLPTNKENDMKQSIEARLTALGIVLPAPAVSRAARIRMARKIGNLVYVSGQLPSWEGELRHVGKVGDELTLAEAQQAARLSALNVLAQARAILPNGLDDIVSVVNLRGFVAVAPDFSQIAEVVNGASDLMMEVFGEDGAHTRTAVGVVSMPHGVSVEIEAMFEIG
jgi:enamine deaminase RidA (YjgF/YER057c/UK114 family)